MSVGKLQIHERNIVVCMFLMCTKGMQYFVQIILCGLYSYNLFVPYNQSALHCSMQYPIPDACNIHVVVYSSTLRIYTGLEINTSKLTFCKVGCTKQHKYTAHVFCEAFLNADAT